MNDSILSTFQRPSRYLGGEPGSAQKDTENVALRFCLAFPDIYELGMSHQGHRILYSVINQREEFFAERVYTPWVDAVEILQDRNLPLCSLETSTPLSKFDAVGFTLSYELAGTNALLMLKLGQIPLRSKNRKDDDPIILAGGPCTLNPEPMSDFIDAFLIGDGEEAVLEIADALVATKGKTRLEKLTALAAIPGVYVPSQKAQSVLPRRRILADLDTTDHPQNPLLPHALAVHNRLTAEIARGCTRGCRFCQAGYIYRPVRERSPEKIAQIIEKGLDRGGYKEVSLLSLSSGDYTCIEPLLTQLIASKAPARISVSLPSMRVESLTPQILEQIGKVRRTGFTIAPEAGTDRLRCVLNKDFTEETILKTVETVFDAGWEMIKLYFMFGLPTETDADIDAIGDLTQKALNIGMSYTNRARINVNVATFVPKSHTPFQWMPQISFEEAKAKMDRIRAIMPKKRVGLKWHNPGMSLVEGALARGNRKTGEAIYEAVKLGCRFDAWDDQFRLDKWRQAFETAGLDLDAETARAYSRQDALPWDVIDAGVTKEYLLSEFDKASDCETTSDCRDGECHDCDACGKEIDVRLANGESKDFGFTKLAPEPSHSMRFRYRIRYSKTKRSRFLSHLEMMSAFLRAMRRAKLPLAYSEGYSPAPKVAFGPPLPLGAQSLDEYLEVLLVKLLPPNQLLELLKPEFLPLGIRLLDCEQIPIKSASLFDRVNSNRYLATLDFEGLTPEMLDEQIQGFDDAISYVFQVQKKKKLKKINLKNLVLSIQRMDENSVLVDLALLPRGGVGIRIALAKLFDLTDQQALEIELLKHSTEFKDDPK
jgi:radical SAM family uncharacterized protein/radical SAM-linked protein